MTYYIGITSATSTGFDFTLYTEGGAAANVTVEEFWITGVTFVIW